VTRKNSISKKGPFTLEYRILVAELVAMEVFLNDGTTKNYTKYWDTILNTSTGPRVLGKEF